MQQEKTPADELAELRALVDELAAALEVANGRAIESLRMVPLLVLLPATVLAQLRDRAAEQGRPASELASLYLWRATREFGGG